MFHGLMNNPVYFFESKNFRVHGNSVEQTYIEFRTD
jgi:hypothetical protein